MRARRDGADNAFLPALSGPASLVITLGASVLIGIGDYLTGADVAFTLLYVMPIAFCTWAVGSRSGAAISIGIWSWALVDTILDGRIVGIAATIWNEIGILVVFVAVAFALGRLREYAIAERRCKRIFVEQLRHADRLNVIGLLASGVAHEIGTPLSVIAGSADLLSTTESGRDRDVLAQMIREQVTRINAIVRHLLAFGRRTATPTSTLDLNTLARSSVALVKAAARQHAVEIIVLPAKAPICVHANSSEIEQVISNLLLNAVQAMPLGGQVSVGLGEVTRADERGVSMPFGSITIEDRGTGIGVDDLPRIFDPFFTTKAVGEGTGLGLSISHGIVRDHGGTIYVDTLAGVGSRFTVLIPLLPADEPRADRDVR